MQADVRMRSERFPRIMAKLELMHEQGKNVDFDPSQALSSVFTYALEPEEKRLGEHVVDLAGIANTPMSARRITSTGTW